LLYIYYIQYLQYLQCIYSPYNNSIYYIDIVYIVSTLYRYIDTSGTTISVWGWTSNVAGYTEEES